MHRDRKIVPNLFPTEDSLPPSTSFHGHSSYTMLPWTRPLLWNAGLGQCLPWTRALRLWRAGLELRSGQGRYNTVESWTGASPWTRTLRLWKAGMGQ